MYRKTESVEPLVDYKLLVTYEGGERRAFDVAPCLGKGVFAQLRDELTFRSVFCEFISCKTQRKVLFCMV